MPTHLADYMNRNFTCRNHLARLAKAGRWALGEGAKFLVSWEEEGKGGEERGAEARRRPNSPMSFSFSLSLSIYIT